MKIYAVVFTDAYEGESLVEYLYLARSSAEKKAEDLRKERPWIAHRYQVEPWEVLGEREDA